MKPSRLILTFAAVTLLLLSLAFGIKHFSGRPKQHACARQLQSLSMLLKSHASEHSGSFPKSLTSLDEVDKALAVPLLSCPGVEPKGTGMGAAIDYTYIDWSGLSTTTTSEVPLVYDRSLSNHGGRGINILMMDGSIKWDNDAMWLKRFAEAHPEITLPID